ncbi:MAG: VCBS repeat-containing protein, partial [Planctomycetes bacterium]|nr:VCBS repeat-containing protein [Planctomycetota bacterium]
EVLAQYARDHQADNAHWKFLTGPRQQLWQLIKQGFKLDVRDDAKNANMIIFHSPRFVLVDRQGRVRGYYEGLEQEGREKLLADLESVLQEEPGSIVAAPKQVAFPEEVLDPPWLQGRRELQLASVHLFKVFHDFQYTDRAPESGITFVNQIVDDAGKYHKAVHYDHGNGLAVADVDGDGLLDLYFTTQIGSNQLWRNLGGGKFENITTPELALADVIGVTASFADTDNDGDPDLFVTSVRGGNHLLINDGRGKFTDVTKHSGLGHLGHSSSGVFFDYDRDGLLDLFLCNVGVYTGDEQGRGGYYVGVLDAFAGHLKPEERNEQSILYRNMGDNRFVDVSEKMRLQDVSWTGDASPIDVNGDGWPDLYVLNMQGHDEYYENVGGKYFEKKSREVFPKTPWGSMGIKVFDFDNDGRFDLFITDMHSDMSEKVGPNREKLKARMKWPESMLRTGGMSIFGNAFFHRQADGGYREVSDAIGAENYWPWGLSVGDLNADGFADVFIASSMNFPFRYGVNTVLINNRGKRFLDAEFILGVEPRRGGRTAKPWFTLDPASEDRDHWLVKKLNLTGPVVVWGALGTRSSAIFDLDGDGDLDIVTNEFNDRPMVLISNLSKKKDVKFLKIKLHGTRSNRDGLGAVVTVRAGAASYTKVHDGKSGYLSQSSLPLYFGLDGAGTVDAIDVVWPSGQRQQIPGPIDVNQLRVIREALVERKR